MLLQSVFGFTPSSGPNLSSSFFFIIVIFKWPRERCWPGCICASVTLGRSGHDTVWYNSEQVPLVCWRPSALPSPEVFLMGSAQHHAAEWGHGAQPCLLLPSSGLEQKGTGQVWEQVSSSPNLTIKGFQSRATCFLLLAGSLEDLSGCKGVSEACAWLGLGMSCVGPWKGRLNISITKRVKKSHCI